MNFLLSKKAMTLAVTAILCTTIQAQKKKTTTTKPSNEGQQAIAVIQYSNAVIELHNQYIEALKSHKTVLETDAESNIEKLKTNIKTTPYAVRCDVSNITVANEKMYRSKVKNIPSVPEKKELQDLSTQAFLWYDKVVTQCGTMSNYFGKKEYTTDAGFAKYSVLKDSLQNSIHQAEKNWLKLGQAASTIGNRAELVLLKNNKLAVYTVPMKQSLIDLRQVMDMLDVENADLSAVNSKLASVQATLAKTDSKSTDFSKLSNEYYKEVYTNFYMNCTDCAVRLQDLINKIKNKADEQNISDTYKFANAAYNHAIEEYNTFIKQ